MESADRIAELESQLQAAEQHQKESDERISNQREEIKRQASELATLHRRIQIYCNWKYESDDKIKSIQKLATPAATPPAQEHPDTALDRLQRLISGPWCVSLMGMPYGPGTEVDFAVHLRNPIDKSHAFGSGPDLESAINAAIIAARTAPEVQR